MQVAERNGAGEIPSGAAAEHWTTESADPADRVDRWQDLLSATHLPWRVDVTATGPSKTGFDAWARRWWIDDLALVDCGCDPCSGRRGAAEVAATDEAFVVVLFTLAGEEVVEQDGVQTHLRPGDAVVWDSLVPARFVVRSRLAKRSLLIPRVALDEVGGRGTFDAAQRLDGSDPSVKLLRTYLESLRTTVAGLDASGLAAARNATLELLVGAMRDGAEVPAGTTTGPAMRAAMDRWIERNLTHHQDLTPDAVARAHGVSVRTLNRVYSATGETFTGVVRARRLARARDELSRTSAMVTTIAHRWGFSDGSHFSRTFKATYGCSPTDYRGGAP